MEVMEIVNGREETMFYPAIKSAFHYAFNAKKNAEAWEAVGAAQATRNCLNHHKVRVELSDEDRIAVDEALEQANNGNEDGNGPLVEHINNNQVGSRPQSRK